MKNVQLSLFGLLMLLLTSCNIEKQLFSCKEISNGILDPDFIKLMEFDSLSSELPGRLGKYNLYVIFPKDKKFYYVTEKMKKKIEMSLKKENCSEIEILKQSQTTWSLKEKQN